MWQTQRAQCSDGEEICGDVDSKGNLILTARSGSGIWSTVQLDASGNFAVLHGTSGAVTTDLAYWDRKSAGWQIRRHCTPEAAGPDGKHKLGGKADKKGDLLFVLENSSGQHCAEVRIEADGSAVSLYDSTGVWRGIWWK